MGGRLLHLTFKYLMPLSGIFALTATLATMSRAQEITNEVKAYSSDLPFEMPAVKLPTFPDRMFNIMDYDAVAGGVAISTAPIQKAIDACSSSGGGTVIIPAGLWLTGPIQMKSNVNLHLNRGALLEFSRDHNDYPIVKVPRQGWIVESPILGVGLENIAISGSGLIDGGGITWRPVKKDKASSTLWKQLLKSGGVISQDGSMWWPTQEAADGERYLGNLRATKKKSELSSEDLLPARDFMRPILVLLIGCDHVLLNGPTFENSPNHILYPSWCEDVVVRNVKILDEYWGQNTDAIDVSSSKNVLIYKCTMSVGDDGICMKSSPSEKSNGPTLQNVVIEDCVVYHAHGGFVIGSNVDGGMENICVRNCNFVGTDIGLRFKSARGKGGLVKNVYINKVYMKDIVHEAVLFDASYDGNGPGEGSPSRNLNLQPVNDKTPVFQEFYIDSVYCDGAGQAVRVAGLPEMPVKDIEFSDCTIKAEKGFESNFATNFTLTRMEIIPKKGRVYSLSESNNFVIDRAVLPKASDIFLYADKGSSKIQLIHTDLSSAKTPVAIGEGADSSAVVQK